MNCADSVMAAVSGGPDSMALLDWLEASGMKPLILHVNYHQRPTASRDEAIVRRWALEHQRPLWILHPSRSSGKSLSGNFQAWAREVRYAFFEQASRAFGLKDLYVGHQQDDHLETWMLQKERGILPSRYGLASLSRYSPFLTIHRPLLGFTKAELEACCRRRGIPFGIDESNLKNHYRRNQLRHARIEPASLEQRRLWLEKLDQDNAALQALRSRVQSLAGNAVTTDCSFLWSDPCGWLVLEQLVFEQTGRHASKGSLEDLLQKLSSKKLQHFDGLLLQAVSRPASKSESSETVLRIRPDVPIVDFYVDSEEMLKAMVQNGFSFGRFQICPSGRTIESFALSGKDFPLVIRPFQAGDRIAGRSGTKKISRLLIDRHVPAIERPFYPVIEGAQGILFASLFGCDPFHFEPVENRRYYMVQLHA